MFTYDDVTQPGAADRRREALFRICDTANHTAGITPLASRYLVQDCILSIAKRFQSVYCQTVLLSIARQF